MESHIRTIEPKEFDDSLRLSQFAFQMTLSEEDRQERIKHYKQEGNWGYFIEGQLAAKLTILNLQCWINGHSFKMGGIAGVATWPEFRRHGMVKKLLIHALQTMKAAGQTVSFLHPFEFPFYRRFGWETLSEMKKYEISKELIVNQFTSVGQMKRTTDWRLLDVLYQAYAKQFTGMLVRDEAWWTRRVMKKSSTAAIYYDEAGKARGYILYSVRNKELNVEELIFLDESARKGLLKFMADHDSMIDKVLLKAPSNDQLAFIMANPRMKHELIPYVMVRIIDVAAFLELLPITAGLEKKKLEMHIRDEFAPWNNGVFVVKWSSTGKAKAKQVDATETPINKALVPTVSCDISTLSALFLGYQRATFLQSIGRLQASEAAIALLEQIIPRKTNYILDFF